MYLYNFTHSHRLEWAVDVKELEGHVLSFLARILDCSSHLERLVISGETFKLTGSRTKDEHEPITADFLVGFISKMEDLQALCLATFQLDPIVIEEVKRRVVEEIIPDRPSFWLHLGNVLPKANDPAVPRIHYEIVNPLNYFYTPPKF